MMSHELAVKKENEKKTKTNEESEGRASNTWTKVVHTYLNIETP